MAQVSITFYYIILNTFGCHIKKKIETLKIARSNATAHLALVKCQTCLVLYTFYFDVFKINIEIITLNSFIRIRI